MADRIAVFNHGRIEQVGTPGRGLQAAEDTASSPISSARPTCCPPSLRQVLGLFGDRRSPASLRPEAIRWPLLGRVARMTRFGHRRGPCSYPRREQPLAASTVDGRAWCAVASVPKAR